MLYNWYKVMSMNHWTSLTIIGNIVLKNKCGILYCTIWCHYQEYHIKYTGVTCAQILLQAIFIRGKLCFGCINILMSELIIYISSFYSTSIII